MQLAREGEVAGAHRNRHLRPDRVVDQLHELNGCPADCARGRENDHGARPKNVPDDEEHTLQAERIAYGESHK